MKITFQFQHTTIYMTANLPSLSVANGIKMGNPLSKSTIIFLIINVLLLFTHGLVHGAVGSAQVPAMFVFGDSLLDDGNNNNLINSFAKANYLPYGIDFNGGRPTGRFCNGRTIVDYLGDLLGLPFLPAYSDTLFMDDNGISSGVNFASAAAGILDISGRHLGERFDLQQQVENFKIIIRRLKNQMDDNVSTQYLAKSLVVMNLGNNDYLNNYLKPSLYPTSSTYSPTVFAHLLIQNYTTYILTLRNQGLRKFLLAGIGPLGCMPNQIAKGGLPTGECVVSVNDMVDLFNLGLRSLVDQLNNYYYPSSIFVYGNTFEVFNDIIQNAAAYGFSVVDRGCCGIGRNQGQITCLPLEFPCLRRDEYVFWDAFHPTQAANRIIAERAYGGSTATIYPINVKQMVQL